ncbi:MAG: hypothetical protein Q8S96_03135 [Hydrogenophaga sp.]|uniref:hypothetical protein n=1 Tax=Hydrogenophaga sp. TaxID=1904254 RepID=UPI0027253A09|nr:hypothetical protein [Hydrogenophaga sp.]MDO9483559.1 hypothetical protein [Hydrogenophaga sp.]MDP3343437.1 hypothetical protein [Hydrogenophaga sp.]MDP3806310.1 hypothetical protein [Hydrogenophaga sp.]MDP3924864.1 hypothetical protein [Hydrogenophaga sp.]
MRILGFLLGGVLALALTGCGGGGGSSGAVVGGTGSGTVVSPIVGGTMTLALVRANGTVVTNNKLSQTEELFLQVSVKDAAGAAVELARVTFELDSADAVMVPVNGVALTSSGIAAIKVAPASVGSQGIVTAKASVVLNGTAIAKEMFLDISPGSVQLQNIVTTPSTVQKGQSLVTSVDVLVNGAKAASNAVGISFSSTCGVVSPALALVDSSGKATAVVQTDAVGTCVVNATYNAVSVQSNFTVTAPPITGIQFVSANPTRIYQAGSTAVKTSIVSFKVIDSLGVGVPTIPVSAELTNKDGGINFCGSPHESINSDSNGVVSFSVCSGSLPATVQVRASIDATPAVYTDSNLLTIQTGLPTQRFFDISASQLNYYVGGHFTTKFNGNETEITVFAADRQGNPVPPGTPIVFVAEGGQLITSGSSSCLIGDTGRCSVTLVGQDYRPLGSPFGDPRPGRVTVLAYADGEESFVDGNFNNRYDDGELFEDLGSPFLDKDESTRFSASYKNLVLGTDDGEFIYPVDAGAIGVSACPSNSNIGLSVQDTCNGRWDGLTKVRRQIVIVFSGGEIGQPGFYDASIPLESQTSVLSASRGGIVVRLADYNGNPLPATAALSAEVLDSVGDCSARLLGSTVGNSTEPTLHQIILEKCTGGETVLLKSTVQTKESALSIRVP